jgi:trk system potassium uptake protein TrkH
MDAVFISCSALSTTGLPLCDVNETFTIFGQVIIILLIQVGGIGIMTIIFLI